MTNFLFNEFVIGDSRGPSPILSPQAGRGDNEDYLLLVLERGIEPPTY